MSESLQLLNKVQQELLGKAYQEDIWKWHMIYSLCGQMALVSLWDAGEDSDDTTDGCISIRHFKKRISQICHAYSALWLQGKPLLRLEELIYTQYRRSGFLYHRDLYVAAAATQCAVCGKIKLHRGIEPEKQFLMSGLGFYQFYENGTEDKPAAELFGLPVQSLSAYLNEMLDGSSWHPQKEWPKGTEFLQLQRTNGGKYWKTAPDKDDCFSLARYGEIRQSYVFYRWDREQERYLASEIPLWRLQDFRADSVESCEAGRLGYRRIASALLLRYDRLPKIHVKIRGNLAEISLGYILPPEEEDFFRLYSWPADYSVYTTDNIKGQDSNHFHRSMIQPVYRQAFRPLMESIGYTFEETD
jgi:hypothetical protein